MSWTMFDIIVILLMLLIFMVLVGLIILLFIDSSGETKESTESRCEARCKKMKLAYQETNKKGEGDREKQYKEQRQQRAKQSELCSQNREDTSQGYKIVINNRSEYVPEQLRRPFNFLGKTLNPPKEEGHYLIFEYNIFNKLKDSLDWGMITKRNRVEQGGVLLGKIATYHNEIYCIVKAFLLADTAGTPSFVEFTSEMWASMQDGLNDINASLDKGKQLAIVGWFHTHPNGLAVFMSGTDMNTQRLNFSREWQVSLVLNPHTNKYRAFFGYKATEGEIVITESQEEIDIANGDGRINGITG